MDKNTKLFKSKTFSQWPHVFRVAPTEKAPILDLLEPDRSLIMMKNFNAFAHKGQKDDSVQIETS